MRRAFTLIEILVVVAIIGAMTSVAVISIRAGQDSARLKGSVRDAFAAIRLARSMALVSKQPSVITYSSIKSGDEICARIEVHTAKPFGSEQVTVAETLDGERVSLSDDDLPAEKSGAEAGGPLGEGEGKSTEDFLFEPADEEIFNGIAVKVVKEGDELSDYGEERAKPKISVFSNVDFLLGRFKEDQDRKEREKTASSPDAVEAAAESDELQEKVSFVWEVNGRTEPHKLWFYLAGTRPDDGLCISVDRFGAAKVLDPEEAE